MATSTLIKSSTTTYTQKELLMYLNDSQQLNFETLAAGIASLGVSVVGTLLKPGIAAKITGAIGVGLSIVGLADIIEDGIKASEMAPYLEKLGTNDSMKITTNLYEWLSGSGNHTAYYTEEKYAIA